MKLNSFIEESDVTIKVQRHIYNHPLYNWCNKSEDMKILVIGDNAYAEKFVDLCLQTGQMLNTELIINWCVQDVKTRDNYLQMRPALRDFVNIDSSDGTDMYANIFFRNIEEALDPYCEDCRYIYVSTEDDHYNKGTADLFKQAVSENCLAAYVAGDNIEVSFNGCPDAPEYIESIDANKRIPSIKELERMAFNTHCIWEGTGNLDYENVKKRFLNPYNYNSSVNFVLSIPYKLKSVGINESNIYTASEKLFDILNKAENDPDSQEALTLTKLALLEHRRWVLEKVTEGVVRLLDKNGAANYAMCVANASIKKKDKAGRLIAHPCIVKSTLETPLINGIFADKKKWDDNAVPTNTLDDLDRMSIEMHRTMLRGSYKIKNNRQTLTQYLECLKNICEINSISKRDFDRYYFCIKNILDKSQTYAFQFETYEKMLRRSIDSFSEEEKNLAKEYMTKISYILFPILECNQYRDYKAYDADLIKHIPFILTGKRDISICMPFGEASSIHSNNDDFFTSVASATALYAERIIYLYVYEYTTNLEIFSSKLKAIRSYFDYRGKDCGVDINVFVSEHRTNQDLLKKLESSLNDAKTCGYIHEFEIINYKDEIENELPSKILSSLDKISFDYYDGTNQLTRSGLINANIVKNISEKYSYFEFDSYNKIFINCHNCTDLRYVRISSFVQVEDMFALLNAHDIEFNYQDYADSYMDYWKIYCGDEINVDTFSLCARSWTKVSNIISSGGSKKLKIENKYIGTSDDEEIDTIKKMLRALKKKGLLTKLIIDSNNRVSLEIRDKKVKGMFNKAGDILETYVYFEACKTGWFDDVQTGYKFRWEFGNVINELDCVLTKDFRSILVECKSTRDVDEGFYLTLDSLADHFGIGYKKVLIIVTDTKNKAYKDYVSRGNQMDIITISKKDELTRIGEKLKEIMLSQ